MFTSPTFGYFSWRTHVQHLDNKDIYYDVWFNWCGNCHTQINHNGCWISFINGIMLFETFLENELNRNKLFQFVGIVATIYCNNISQYGNHNLSRITLNYFLFSFSKNQIDIELFLISSTSWTCMGYQSLFMIFVKYSLEIRFILYQIFFGDMFNSL